MVEDPVTKCEFCDKPIADKREYWNHLRFDKVCGLKFIDATEKSPTPSVFQDSADNFGTMLIRLPLLEVRYLLFHLKMASSEQPVLANKFWQTYPSSFTIPLNTAL